MENQEPDKTDASSDGHIDPVRTGPCEKTVTPQHTIGVLFVHGIGEQLEGDTLVRFAEPVMKWISEWVDQPEVNYCGKRGSVEILKSDMGTRRFGSSEPAHVVFKLETRYHSTATESHRHNSSWLFAESWWASKFRRPPFGEIARWMLTTGSWMILSHAGKTIRLASGCWWRKTRAIASLAFLMIFAFLVQVSVVILALFAIIPSVALRERLSGLLLKLTGTIGDSYIMVSSPVQKAAAVTHLRNDLNWLSDQCETIVIIAHSQGAAIAHEALKDPKPDNVRLLITFGSGLSKLEELKLVMCSEAIDLTLAQFVMPVFAIAVLFYPILYNSTDNSIDFLFIYVITFSLFLLVCVLSTALRGWESYLKHIKTLSLLLYRPQLKWLDFYSSADPVPNGPLGGKDAVVEGLTTKKVFNLMSVTRDHSTYWDNRDEFISSLVSELDSIGKTRLIRSQDRDRLKQAAISRKLRVRWLYILRMVSIGSIVFALIGLRGQLSWIGEFAIYNTLKDTPVISGVASFLLWIGSAAQVVSVHVIGLNKELSRAIGFGVLGAVIPTAILLIWYMLTFKLWKLWDNIAIRRFFTPEPFRESHRFIRELPMRVAVVVGLLPIAVASATWFWPEPKVLWGKVLATLLLTGNTYSVYALAVIVILLSFYVLSIAYLWIRKLWKKRAIQESNHRT